MHRDTRCVSAVADFIGHGLRVHGAAGHVVGVLQRDQPGLRAVVDAGAIFFLMSLQFSARVLAEDGDAACIRRRNDSMAIS